MRTTRIQASSVGLMAVLWAVCHTAGVAAQQPAIDRVEESWEVKVNHPASERGSPQLLLGTRPDPDSPIQCRLNINFRQYFDSGSTPDPAGSAVVGGLQLQIAKGGDNPLQKSNFGTAVLARNHEVLKLTTFMERDGQTFRYGVVNVESKTWGKVNGTKDFTPVEVADSALTFPSYSVDVPLDESGVLFGANRVDHMKLTTVRYYSGGQLIETVKVSKDEGTVGSE